ncbi:MAG TPA: HipA domain-containing protein [Acidimicrobiales bacterium]|nr:HipA domain-containing protein [Acidimicrobiales bacterium]
MTDELAIWLHGDRVATVSREANNRLRLRYTQDALARYELGTPLLSIGLPLTDVHYPNAKTRSFLDGLLPEADQRRAVAEQLNLNSNDTFGLIRELGLDCAGAIVVQPAAKPAPREATTLTAAPLTEEEIVERVANLKSAPLGVTDRVRISLAGVQQKLLLTRMPDGRWGAPIDGTPSTHILKPEVRDLPNAVENEAFCMRVAHNLGLRTASIETTEYGGRKLIVVERYDRVTGASGDVERVHQEDFCQVLSLPPKTKYQQDGGPSLVRVAAVLRQFAQPDSLSRLLQATYVTVLVGNGDAHGKNISLLHHPDGSIELTPIYDVVSTLHYVDGELAMYIDDVRKTSRVTRQRLVNEAVSWGMREDSALLIVGDLSERAPEAIAQARDETPGVPDGIIEIAQRQRVQLAS